MCRKVFVSGTCNMYRKTTEGTISNMHFQLSTSDDKSVTLLHIYTIVYSILDDSDNNVIIEIKPNMNRNYSNK